MSNRRVYVRDPRVIGCVAHPSTEGCFCEVTYDGDKFTVHGISSKEAALALLSKINVSIPAQRFACLPCSEAAQRPHHDPVTHSSQAECERHLSTRQATKLDKWVPLSTIGDHESDE